MRTTDVLADVRTNGYVRLAEGFDPSDAAAMRALVWRALGERGLGVEDDPATWPVGRAGKSPVQALQHRAFRAFWSDEVVSAVDALLGRGSWTRPATSGDILVTFPDKSSPVRRLDPFHSDFAMDIPADPLFAVKIFAFIGAVGPSSGGTLVIRGSHLLVQRYLDALPPGFPRRRAAAQFGGERHPWLQESAEGPLIGATFDSAGIELRIEELTGEPGDVFITHPWTLHAGVTSIGETPRIMLGHRIFREPAS